MKKLSFVFGFIAMICIAIGFSSCEKESALQNSENTPEFVNCENHCDDGHNVDTIDLSNTNTTRDVFGTCLADNVSHYMTNTFTASAGTSYYIRVNGDRLQPLYFYVKNTSSSSINVKAYLGGPYTYTQYLSQNISSYEGTLFTLCGANINACYQYLIVQINNNNSSSVSGIKWTANFTDE